MSVGSDAADQMVREGIQITESAVKLAGLGAKHLAALLLALLRDHKKLKGKTGINKLVQAEKPLSIFYVKKSDIGKFKSLANEYGVLFAPVYNKTLDKGICDVLVKSEDAARVNRIMETLEYPAPEKPGKNAGSRVPQEPKSTGRGNGWLNQQIQRRSDPVKKHEKKTAMLEGSGAETLAALCLHIARENCKEQGASELSRLLGSGKEFQAVEISAGIVPAADKKIRALGLPVQFQNFEDGKCQMIARAEDAPLINRVFESMDLQPPMKAGISQEQPERTGQGRRKKRGDRQSVRHRVEAAKEKSNSIDQGTSPPPARELAGTGEKSSVRDAFEAAKQTLSQVPAPKKGARAAEKAR